MGKSRIEALTEKRNQINAQIQALRSKEQVQKRKDDTRRKILVGSVVMKLLKKGEIDGDQFKVWMDQNLDKERDRRLFDLLE